MQLATKGTVIWDSTTVDDSSDVGGYNSLALDSGHDPHIAYYDATEQNLKYAYILRTECNDKKDNDNDGDVDYPNDSNCTSELDPSESWRCYRSKFFGWLCLKPAVIVFMIILGAGIVYGVRRYKS